MKNRVIGVAAVAVFGVATAAIATSYEADATPNEKVTICHATSSETNPYTVNRVDESSVDEQNNQYLNGHGEHERDIIPPFRDFEGRNWDAAGQAIWNNGCKIPAPSPQEVTPVAPALGEPTCDPPRDINITDVTGVQYTRTTNTDGSITVTATPASDDYVFTAGAETQWTFTAADLAELPEGGCDVPTDPEEPGGETEPPTGVAGETATNTPAPEVTTPEQVAAQPATLPETGAETWTIFLIGLASAAAGLVLVRLARQPA